MAKLIVFNLISVDGFFESIDNSLDWFNADEEFNEFALNQLKSIHAILYGRITYEGMFEYWTSEMAAQSDLEMTTLMNETKKFVFSKTLNSLKWKNAELISNELISKVNEIKKTYSKDIIVFGSGNLITSLIELKLVDGFRLMVVPVLLGKGKRLFQDLSNTTNLKSLDKKQFDSGNLLLTYEVL
jgi:dihydrofolate reductase